MCKAQKGQTLIETALVLTLLLLILLGIAEFARAWYTKSSTKNAARTAARLAVVTPGSGFPSGVGPPFGTEVEFICPSANGILNITCTSPGIRNDNSTHVFLEVDDINIVGGDGILDVGDLIRVRVQINFATIAPIILGSFIPSQFSSDVSMRYEL
jgi:hypothetical protein